MPSENATRGRPSTYRPRIPNSTWEKYLPEIKRLYLNESRPLIGENGVIEEMKRLHDFHANEGQYYAMFKKQRISKNVKRQDWSLLFAHLERTQLRGKHNVIKFNGRSYTEQQIATAIRHHGRFCTTLDHVQDFQVDFPTTFDACTSSSNFAIETSDRAPSSHTTSMEIISLGQRQDLPSTDHREAVPGNSPFISTEQADEPFHWHKFLTWDVLVPFMTSQQGLVPFLRYTALQQSSTGSSKVLLPTLYMQQMKSLFWPSPDLHTSCMRAVGVTMAKYLLSTFFNSMVGLEQIDLSSTHKWIASLPPNTVLQFFRKFRQEEMAILRDRIFSAAVYHGYKDTVLLMLSLNPDLVEVMSFGVGDRGYTATPIRCALMEGQLEVAKVLVKRRCERANPESLSLVLDEIIDSLPKFSHIPQWNVFSASDQSSLREILHIPLNTLQSERNFPRRIRLTAGCFLVVVADKSLLTRLLESQEGLAQIWLKQGYFRIILDICFEEDSTVASPALQIILDWIARENFESGFVDQPMNNEILYKSTKYPDSCWFFPIMKDFRSRLGILEPIAQPVKPKFGDLLYRPFKEPFLAAIARGDSEFIVGLLNSRGPFSHDGSDVFNRYMDLIRHAIASGQDEIAIELICVNAAFKHHGMLVLMLCNRLAAVSMLLHIDETWHSALRRGSEHKDYRELEKKIFFTHFPRPEASEQLYLRAISYHAIDVNDQDLLEFALDSGVLCEGVECIVDEYFLQYLWFMRLPLANPGVHSLPSLLAVAASRDRLSMIELLVAHGSDVRESAALRHAIKYHAIHGTISALLDLAVGKRRPYRVCGYGAAGLIEAIQQHRHDTIRLIANRTDVNSMDQRRDVTPLGQAILERDTEAVRILIDHGANPNRLVAYHAVPGPDSTYIGRLTPILSAIEVGDMCTLRLLVERGAFIEKSPKYNLCRSPLQRAAEIGNFEAVEYLLHEGAKVDFNGIYDSGTALQLAAIKGYIGIARLLIQHGADVNATPAEGQGRTALEGAAEWGRLDMISLLIKHGVDWDLPIGVDREPQALRAMELARQSGHGALARYIESLWQKHKEKQAAARDYPWQYEVDYQAGHSEPEPGLEDFWAGSPISFMQNWYSQLD